MEIKLFDNLKNALKDNRDVMAEDDSGYPYGEYSDEDLVYESERSEFDEENSLLDQTEEQEMAPAESRASNVTLKVVKPTAYSDGPDIADILRDGSTVVLNLEDMNRENAIRLIDFLLGVAHVLEADMKKVSANTIVIAPGGIEETEPERDDDHGYDNE